MPFGPRYYTGIRFPETVTMEFEERYNFSTLQFLQNEYDRIYDYSQRKFNVLSGESELPDGVLTLFAGDSNQQRKEVASFKFLNMRITEIGDLSFDQAANDLLAYEVTFSVEEIIPSTLTNV